MLLILLTLVSGARGGGDAWVLCPTDSALVLIPGGCFEMGSDSGEKDEKPVHRVHVDSFYLGKAEVTIWEYLECVYDGACGLPSWWNRNFFDEAYVHASGTEWLRMPVVGVSWDDANKFCAWKGASYRLPTEAEWEYAARGGVSEAYPWGKDFGNAAQYAVVEKRLSAVMSRAPNRLGVYDMIGNAWEWCNDRYDRGYYAVSETNNPQGPKNTRRKYRVVRGGAWNEYPWNLRSANRSFGEQNRPFGGVGFRICRDLQGQ